MNKVASSSPYDVFLATAKLYSDRPFLHIPSSAAKFYQPDPVDLSYAQTKDEIVRLRNIYSSAGYACGHRIALVLENRAEFFVHWLALNALGVSVVPVNAEFPIDEMIYIIDYSDACLVVTLPDHAEKIAQATKSIGRSIPMIQTNNLSNLPPPPLSSVKEIDVATECAMLFTSGSTGKPKGCILSNEYFLEMGNWYAALGGYCQLDMGVERLITPLPLVHMNALTCSTMGMIATGGCIIQLDRFHPSTWRQSVRDSGATIIHYLGVMPAMLLTLNPNPSDRDHQVKFGFGAGVSPKYHGAFEERFGFPLIEGWAMTETGSGGCIMANHRPRHVGTCCFGKQPPTVEVKVIGETGDVAEIGEPGELLVRAAGRNPRKGFFTGYYNNSDATKNAWKDGWFHTGDLVKSNTDGSLHFVDRLKNIIRRSGENISALEVEVALAQHRAVQTVVVSAVEDDLRGDEVMATVILVDGAENNIAVASDIFEGAQRSLIYYKLPDFIAFVDALPITASQKPKRGEMRAFAEDLIREDKVFDFRPRKRRPKQQLSQG